MANWEALSFGGWDPIMSAFESNFNIAQGKKASKVSNKQSEHLMRYQAMLARQQMEFQSNLNKANQTWSANIMPSETVKGLRAAGLNPMLAYTDFSGLASSGAMGVTPSMPSAASGSIDPSSGDSGVSVGTAGIDWLRGLGNSSKAKKVEKENLAGALETAKENKEYARDQAASANQLALQEREVKSQELETRSIENAMKTYLLGHELSATTGKQYSTHQGKGLAGSDAANQFWNDFFREQLDLKKYMNSATRAKVLDSIHGLQSGAAGLSSLTDLIPSRLSKIRRFFRWK